MKAINELNDQQLETIGLMRFKRENARHSITIKSFTIMDTFQTGETLTDVSFLVKTEQFADQRFAISLEYFFLDEIVALHDFGAIDKIVSEHYK